MAIFGAVTPGRTLTGDDDVLTGTDGNDILHGGGGNDTLWGDAGDDVLTGGYGSQFGHWLFGSVAGIGPDLAGLDIFANPTGSEDGNDELHGGEGNDLLIGDEGDNVLYGDEGNDIVVAGGANYGNNKLYGGAGNDYLEGGGLSNLLDGGEGDDILVGVRSSSNIFYGGKGNDTLYAYIESWNTYRFDRGDGQDWIVEGGVSDIIEFGEGILLSDVWASSDFDDDYGDVPVLNYSATGTDKISGYWPYVSEIRFDDGTVLERAQIDVLLEGGSLATGTDAADTFIGGTGDDYYAGGFGNDTLRGGEGNDSLNGGADNDTLYAGRGNDVLRGGNGNDKLYGEAGNDVYHGGRGNDSFTDTQGDDTYYFAQGDGADTLLDTQGEDTLVFEGIDHTSLWFTQTGPNGRNLEISVYGTDDKITVTDWFLSGSRQIEHIQAGDYVLDGAEVAALAEALADFGPTMVGEGDYLLLRWPDEIFDQYWNAV